MTWKTAVVRMLGRLTTPRTAFRLTHRLPYIEARPSSHVETPLGPGFQPGAPVTSIEGEQIGPLRCHVISVPQGTATLKGAVFDADLKFVRRALHRYRDTAGWWDRFTGPGVVASDYWPGEEISTAGGTVVALTSSNQEFYFHWLLDVVPRIHLGMRLFPDADRYYVDTRLPFQRESLTALGVPEARTTCASRTMLLAADEIVVPCHQYRTKHHVPQWVLDLLRNTFRSGDRAGPRTRRVFISRQSAKSRRLRNEDQVAEALADHGFERVRLETLTIAEQARTFRDAEMVVAPHGSGLANLVFLEPGARVIELMPDFRLDLFASLAASAGAQYSVVYGQNASGRTDLYDDFTVELADVLAEVTRGPPPPD